MGDGHKSSGDVGGCVLGAERIAFFQKRGEVGGERRLFGGFGGQHHRGQSGMGADPSHFPASGGDAVLQVQGAEVFQQRGRGGQGSGRWLVLEGQVRRRRAPGGAFQHQTRKFGFQDFGPVEGGQAPVQRWRPDADGGSRAFAARSAGALIGGGAGNPGGGQSGSGR